MLNLLYIFCLTTNKNSEFFFEKHNFQKDFFDFSSFGWAVRGRRVVLGGTPMVLDRRRAAPLRPACNFFANYNFIEFICFYLQFVSEYMLHSDMAHRKTAKTPTKAFPGRKKQFIKNLQNVFFVYNFALATENHCIYATFSHIVATGIRKKNF